MTPWERKLWYLFLKNHPVHFYRQRPIDSFIVDFYCSRLKLAIELDGSQHFEQSGLKYDEERTKRLNLRGIEVIRIANNEIDQNFTGVCEYLNDLIQKKSESLKAESLTKENP
ncbi:MAG: endonuclease domain-containing protein [Clostridia bacterium]|nr:endonuclease domain-containing protein [Clostridia bacterium]